MYIWETIIDALQTSPSNVLSFSELVEKCNASETIVQESLTRLINQGFPIKVNKNQLLLDFPLLSKKEILSNLETDSIAKQMTVFDSIDSTNTYAKSHLSSLSHGEVLLAHEQVQGRGRLGRFWSSPTGKSISMTLVLKPAELLTDASLLTQLTAASLVNALSETASLEIKWPNDVLLNRKKIAGILTEAEFSGSKLSGIIIGMGINTNIEKKDIPQDIMDKATSLRIETNETINPNSLLQSFFKHFENYYDAFTQNKQYEPFLEVCRKHSALIDRTMWLHDGNKRRQIFVETIDTNGGLVIKDCLTQKRETLTSTHFSIRGENGYI